MIESRMRRIGIEAFIGRWMMSLCLALAICSLAASYEAWSQDKEPFHRLREQTSDFVGPDGDTVAVSDIEEVRIGYFGPSDGQDPAAGIMWQAAQAAIEDANQRDGLAGKPFRLIPAWSADPWGTGVAQLARLVYRDKVWAIVGGVDGPSTHLAEQVVAKARLPLISPVCTDKTANLANVPWLFSLAPGDHLIAPVLAVEIDRRVGGRHWIMISSDDHDSRQLAGELKKALSQRGSSPQFQFVYRQSAPEFSALVHRTVDHDPAAVVILADVDDSARLARLLRASQYAGELFGGPCVGRHRFFELAGEAAQGVVFPRLTERDSKPSARAATRHGDSDVGDADSWDYAADLTYDAVQLTVAAIRRGGLNRVRIRDAIRDLAPWHGRAGTVRWDPLGSNTRRAGLAVIVDGRVQCLPDSESTR